ncbi:MAG: chlorite dismutase [Acidimicrobiaceae bacterium]|nr:chlorite dismutase [Acidimicrobiaceae bacterium]MYJ43320.1 chlorite dismutase [Acidimicrobiaceae bacterium]
MMEAVGVSQGLVVVHLFCARTPDTDDAAVLNAVKDATEAGTQVVTVAVLGHKAQLCFMGLHADAWALRDLQAGLVRAGLDVVDSYVSITELSEYALGLPAEMADMRLNPKLPPPDKPAWCFYPMTKRRNVGQNWYELSFDERKELMLAHGASGREFAGRIVQLVTASTGLDDWEWGVTLFGEDIGALKETVYTMRYDRASAAYAEFGPFVTGLVGPADEILARV